MLAARKLTSKKKTVATHGMLVLAGLGALLFLSGSPSGGTGLDTSSEGVEVRARALEAKLMAPCCFSETIDQHQSQAAREMRAEVRQWLAQGLSEEQILHRYEARYGAQILAVPPPRGFNRLLYWMPHLVTLVLLVAVFLTLWVWYRRGHFTGAPRDVPKWPADSDKSFRR